MSLNNTSERGLNTLTAIIKENFKNFKVNFIAKVIGLNTLLSWIFIILIQNDDNKSAFLLIFSTFFTFNMIIRSISAIIFNIKYFWVDIVNYDKSLIENKKKY